MLLGSLKLKPHVYYVLHGDVVRSTMNLGLLKSVPHSETRALRANPLTQKKNGKQSDGETRKEKRKKAEKKVQVPRPTVALRRMV
jgi:hypothetical protein